MASQPPPASSATSSSSLSSISDDDSTASRGPPAKRVQLDDLPSEIHTSIARLCYQADLRLDDAFADLKRRGGLASNMSLDLDAFRKSYGRTVVALRAVSKKWRTVCDCFVFKNLVARQATNPMFTLVIVPAYGQHFTHLDMLNASAVHLTELAKGLPSLPNLRHIVLPARPLDKLLQSTAAPVAVVIRSTLLISLRKIDQLATGRSSLSECLEITNSCSASLRRLTLSCASPDILPALWDILQPLPNLNFLDLYVLPKLGAWTQDMSFEDLTSTPTMTMPRLETLSIQFRRVPRNLPAFVSLFSSSLHELWIHIIDAGSDPSSLGTHQILPITSMPALTYVQLIAKSTVLDAAFRAAQPEMVPSLSQMAILHIGDGTVAPTASAHMLAYIRDHGRVEDITISQYSDRQTRALEDAEAVELESLVPVVDIGPELYPHLAMNGPNAIQAWCCDEARPANRPIALRMLDDLLEYMKQWRNRAILAQDWADVARLATALQHVDFERMLHDA
ncbi:hypothetical protein JCM10908_000499 [Rhodotorula pacifica]|uniref:uncharacterized protein n=1 Tax=Rhodotorula pacifica TaxID=1495444 RepID=UPI0031804F7C